MKMIQGKELIELKKFPKNAVVFIPETKADRKILLDYVKLSEFSNSERKKKSS